jgi:hypothetical protein
LLEKFWVKHVTPYAALADLVFGAILGGEYDKSRPKAFCGHFMRVDACSALFGRSTRFLLRWVAAKAAESVWHRLAYPQRAGGRQAARPQ